MPRLPERVAGPPESIQKESGTEHAEHQSSHGSNSVGIALPPETVICRDEMISEVRVQEERTENLEDSGVQLEISGTWIEVPDQDEFEHETHGYYPAALY